MSDTPPSLSGSSSAVILANSTRNPGIMKMPITEPPESSPQGTVPRQFLDNNNEHRQSSNPEDIPLPIPISEPDSNLALDRLMEDDVDSSRSPSPLPTLADEHHKTSNGNSTLPHYSSNDTRVSLKLRRSGSLFKRQYTWSTPSQSQSRSGVISPLSSINSDSLASYEESDETPSLSRVGTSASSTPTSPNNFFKPNLSHKFHRLAFNNLTSPVFTKHHSVPEQSSFFASQSVVSNPRLFGIESTRTGSAGSVSANTTLPFSLLSIITSRPRHLYHSLKTLTTSDYSEFWSLDKSERLQLSQWNNVEFKIQQKLFKVFTILKKFRYETRRLVDYYGPEFLETDIIFSPKNQEARHRLTFSVLSSLADQLDYLVEDKLKPAYDETLLVNDEYILLQSKVWFEELEKIYFSYATAISLLSKLTTDQKVSDWIKIVEETDISLIRNPSVVSARVLLSCYFIKLFTPLILALQELSSLYQKSNNDYMLGLSNDILNLAKRLNNMTDYTTTRESLSDLMTDQSTDIELLEDAMFSESHDISTFDTSDFASFWQLEGQACKTLFSSYRLELDIQSKLLQFYVLLDGIRWDLRHMVTYYGDHFKYTTPALSFSDVSKFMDDDFYDNTFGKLYCLYESIDSFLSKELSITYDTNLLINDKCALKQSLKWFNRLDDTINLCADSISRLARLASSNPQFQEWLIEWNQSDTEASKFSIFKNGPVDLFTYYFIEFLNPLALTIYDLRQLYFVTGDSAQFNLSEDLYSSITKLNSIIDTAIRTTAPTTTTPSRLLDNFLPSNIRLILTSRTTPQIHNMDYFDGLQYSEFWSLSSSECRNFRKWDKMKYDTQNRIFEFYLVLKRIRFNFKRMVEYYAPEFQNARGITPTYSTDYQDVFVPIIGVLNRIEKLVNVDLKPYYDNTFFVNDKEVLEVANEWFKQLEANHFDVFAKNMSYLKSLSQDPNLKLWLGRVAKKDLVGKNNRYATDGSDLFSRYFLSFLTPVGLLVTKIHQAYDQAGDDEMSQLTQKLLDCVTRLNEACDAATNK